MKLTELSFKLLFLFIPGIIFLLIHWPLVTKRKLEPFYFIIYSFVAAITSYYTYWAIKIILIFFWPNFYSDKKIGTNLYFFNSLNEPSFNINFFEIFIVCMVSVLLAILYSLIRTKKIFHRFLSFLKVTNIVADNDIWDFTINSSTNSGWIVIRDLENDLMYQGYVIAASEIHSEFEVLLKNVIVYKNNNAKELYSVDKIYLTLEKDKILIELSDSNIKETNLQKKNKKKRKKRKK